jgi:hypothetical protein
MVFPPGVHSESTNHRSSATIATESPIQSSIELIYNLQYNVDEFQTLFALEPQVLRQIMFGIRLHCIGDLIYRIFHDEVVKYSIYRSTIA